MFDILIHSFPNDGGNGGGPRPRPFIHASWSMKNSRDGTTWYGADEGDRAGAQFIPTGIWGDPGTLSIVSCVFVENSQTMDALQNVRASVYYPKDRAFLPVPENSPDQLRGGTGERLVRGTWMF